MSRAKVPTSQRVNVHLFESTGANESRFLKEAKSLLTRNVADRVVLVGRWRDGFSRSEILFDGCDVRRLPRLTEILPRHPVFGAVKMVESQSRYAVAAARLKPATIHCHGVFTLPSAVAAKKMTGAHLVYDPHELETEKNGVGGIQQRVDRWIEQSMIGACDSVICVSDSIADWYATTYKISRPIVVRNIPDTRGADRVARVGLRNRLGISDDSILFVYTGGLFRGRRIEQFLRLFQRMGPTRHVVIIGFGELEPLVKEAARAHSNIHFIPAVPAAEVVDYAAAADVGLCGVENVCLSYFYSLPNKLFEYLIAGVPVLVPPYPEMAAIVDRHGCGWIVQEDDEEWMKVISGLSPQMIERGKRKARDAARQYSWSNEEAQLLEAYQRVN